MNHFKVILLTKVGWCDSQKFSSPTSHLLFVTDALCKSGTYAFLVKSRTMTIFHCLLCWLKKYEEIQKMFKIVRISLHFKKIKDYSERIMGIKFRKAERDCLQSQIRQLSGSMFSEWRNLRTNIHISNTIERFPGEGMLNRTLNKFYYAKKKKKKRVFISYLMKTP